MSRRARRELREEDDGRESGCGHTLPRRRRACGVLGVLDLLDVLGVLDLLDV
ncbi:hypothetical protein OG453_12695 [Streptomyces sp. NBC_01381]|uniref:hypothetical protein n=1 Tax=Streptomyces sp. NBC_01381 TaxID=2903845 RepID=UPI002254F75A|nr:hypothetical protein [Streptomyces sp. NBC_01381]MCX4667512.1 hypothetical protein [Streptomyces sp. NBC_01381]